MADKVVVVRLRAAVGEYTSGLARAGGQAVTFGGQLSTAASRQDAALIKARTSMAAMATGAAVAGKLMLLGIGGAMVVSAKAAIDFESSLAGVAKTVEGTTAQITAIGNSMRRLSTQIPVNVNELNRIAELGGQLGVSIPGLLNFTKTIAALGVTTNLSTDDAAKGLARLINVTGAGEEAFDNLGSVIVDLGNNFATTEAEILTFALRIAPSAQTVGATAEEVLGLAAALSSMGVPAERGGTAVQTMFTIMASAARSGGDDLNAMATIVGQTTSEFQDMILNSPTNALVELAAGLGRANDEGLDVFSMMRRIGIMGRRAQAVLLAMANNTDLVTDSLDRATTAGEENTALFEEAARRYGTTASEIQLMGNAFTDLRIELGQDLLPFIRQTVQTMAALFSLMRDNSGTVQLLGKLILGLGLGLMVVGLIRGVVAMHAFWVATKAAMVAASGFSKSVAAMNFALGPIGIALGVAAIAVAAIGIASINAAQNLAALKQSADEYRMAVERGIDPTQALINVLDPDELRAAAEGFDQIGVSIGEVSDAAHDPAELAEFIRLLQDERNRLQAIFDTMAAQDIAGFGFDQAALQSDIDLLDASIAAAIEFGKVVEQEITDRATEMALAVQAAGFATSMTFAELLTDARDFARAFPKGVPEDFVASFTNLTEADRLLLQHGENVKAGLVRTEGAWQSYLNLTEEGTERLEAFDKDIIKLAESFATEVTDAFDEVRETVLEGFPAWDEYGDSAKVAIGKVIAAQDRMLADVQRWAPAQASLIGTVSAATLQWFDDLGPLEKGALGRLFANDPLKFGKFATDVDDNLAELAAAADAHLVTRLPQILNSAILTAEGKIQALVDELGLPRGDAEFIVGAFEDGLSDFFNALPASLGDDARLAILALLDPSQSAVAIAEKGAMTAGWFIDGVERALLEGNLTLRVAVEEGVVDPIVDAADRKFGIDSPSKVAMRIGRDFTEGLSIGMASNLDTSMFQRVQPAFQTMMDQSGVPTVKVTPSGGDLTINHPHHPTDDLSKDLQRADVLGKFQRMAEVGSINDT